MEVQNLYKKKRNSIIREVCKQGAVFRQLARITGISYGIIQRVATDQSPLIYYGQTTYHYYAKDHLGNNRAVINHNTGAIEHVTHYYPFGAVYGDVGTNDALQRYKYNGKELDRMHGLNQYDYGARNYDPLMCSFTQMDPLAEKYYNNNPYAYCINNPINCIDFNGCDTIYVNKVENKWVFNDPIISDGNDVFIVNDGENSTTIIYDEGEYGERVCTLNLDINEDYTLGVYYVSGSGGKALGYYVTPGGTPSTNDNTGARIPEGSYPILAPNGGKWQQPQVGGNVASRGIRFHYGYLTPRDWTEGCFVLSNDYYVGGGNIRFSKQNSINAVQEFDLLLSDKNRN